MYATLLVFLSLIVFLWMFIPVSECIIVHFWCICTYLDPCFSLSFSLIVYVCVRLYCHWLYVYRYISYSAFLSISLYLSFSESGCIIGKLHVCEQARTSRSVWNSVLEKWCMIIIIPACIYTSLDSYFRLISLALNFRSRFRICNDSLYVHIVFFSFRFVLCLRIYVIMFG